MPAAVNAWITRPLLLNGRLELLTNAVDELVDELYTALHRAADSPR